MLQLNSYSKDLNLVYGSSCRMKDDVACDLDINIFFIIIFFYNFRTITFYC